VATKLSFNVATNSFTPNENTDIFRPNRTTLALRIFGRNRNLAIGENF
jgi:hypothetical protein